MLSNRDFMVCHFQMDGDYLATDSKNAAWKKKPVIMHNHAYKNLWTRIL